MRVRVVFRAVGGGFVVDTPTGVIMVLDPSLSLRAQVALCAELLDDREFAQVYPLSLSA